MACDVGLGCARPAADRPGRAGAPGPASRAPRHSGPGTRGGSVESGLSSSPAHERSRSTRHRGMRCWPGASGRSRPRRGGGPRPASSPDSGRAGPAGTGGPRRAPAPSGGRPIGQQEGPRRCERRILAAGRTRAPSRSASFAARATTKSEFSRLSDWSGTVEGRRRVQVVTIEGASKTSSRLATWVRRCWR